MGLAIGVAAAAVIVLAFRIPGGADALPGASVVFASAASGEVSVSPAGVFLRAHDLLPAGTASGRLTVRNITGKPRAIRLHAIAQDRDLDGILRVEVVAGRMRIFAGTLAALRTGTRTLMLRPGERRALILHVSLPAGASAFAAQGASVTLHASSGAVTAP